jgi:hypothetical protein
LSVSIIIGFFAVRPRLENYTSGSKLLPNSQKEGFGYTNLERTAFGQQAVSHS